MSEQLLQQILHAVTHIQQELREIREEQRVIREEQREIREEQRVIREEQQALKNGQKELYDLVNALIHRQEETDTKLESLTMDVHRMHGEITAMKQEIRTLNEKVDSHYEQLNERLNNLQLDVDFTVHKTTMTERELFKMRNRLF